MIWLSVDPVHVFLSLSSETEFRRRPLPNPVPAVANYGIMGRLDSLF